MQHQIELGYLVLEVPDPDTLEPVFSDVIGLIRHDTTDGVVWRNDDRAQRVIVTPGPANDATVVGFEAVDAAAFDATVARLRAIGYEVADGTGADAAERRVERLARTTAPWGLQVEIALGMEHVDAPVRSELVPGGFHTDGVGFGHAVFATQDLDAATRFLVEGLGFGQSDWIETELAPGFPIEVRFFHCNERHHTIALALVPFEVPQRLHHIMFETNERDDVGTAFDRAWAADLPIPNGLGRHDNDGMFSFYLQTPVGFQIEIGYGARVITDDWAENRAYDSISSWGHQPLRQA
ncbi:MAG TPA: VOC family protein [Ilumatobacteraceae bacterium]|nr:VOC family protein [Ilumatobacteraceae bacterium]